jgi:hypothetical protein
LLTFAGCGGTGDLSGKVSYNGKPLVVGSVLLIGVDNKPRTTWIEDGTYHFAGVPVGEAKIAVFSPDPAEVEARRRRSSARRSPPRQQDAPRPPAVDNSSWFPIPAEYSDIDHPELRATINRGPNTYDLEMK